MLWSGVILDLCRPYKDEPFDRFIWITAHFKTHAVYIQLSWVLCLFGNLLEGVLKPDQQQERIFR